MNDYNCIINSVKKIKEHVQLNYYNSSEDLEQDFYKVCEYFNREISSLTEKDLNNMFNTELFFITELCKIHAMENDPVNMETFKTNINIKEAAPHLKDSKRAFNIYFFNDSNLNYYIIGDLHSDTISLKTILKKINFFKAVTDKNIKLIFLGDYIDRGKAPLKLLWYVSLLKYIFPNNIFLLKGNHDGGTIVDGSVKLCVGKNKNTTDNDYFLLYLDNLLKDNIQLRTKVIQGYLNFFNSLCTIAFINHKKLTILAVHGGIPRPKKNSSSFYDYINSISDLTNDNIVDNINRTICHNILWSDPCDNNDDLREDSGRFGFNIKHFQSFQNTLGFDLLIRGHEAEEKGYKKFFNDKLITIFSSGMILENTKNVNYETAYDDITPKIIKLDIQGNVIILDL